MVRLDVTSERGRYPVLVGPGLSRQLPDLLKLAGVADAGLVISSPAIWNRHAPRLRRPGGFGAAALVVTSASRAAQLGLKPLARIVGQATSGLHPKYLLMTPVEAVRRLAEKVTWNLADVDLFAAGRA